MNSMFGISYTLYRYFFFIVFSTIKNKYCDQIVGMLFHKMLILNIIKNNFIFDRDEGEVKICIFLGNKIIFKC